LALARIVGLAFVSLAFEGIDRRQGVALVCLLARTLH
jgi:hypothetical protein